MINAILLTNDEKFIRNLDPDKLEILETCELGEISQLTITYPLGEDIQKDITKDFIPGNKLFLTGASGLNDCLYIIDEEVKSDLWKENNITVTLEDVLVELNYAPFISQLDVPKATVVTGPLLEKWFGNYYNIEKKTVGSETYYLYVDSARELTTIYSNDSESSTTSSFVTINGSMSLMSWLRSIEEQTGNVFRTRYLWNDSKKVIERYLDFLNPSKIGKNYEDVIDLGFNTDDIIYSMDESDCYRSCSPVTSYSTDDTGVSKAALNIVLSEYNFMDINVGDEIPMILTKQTGPYPGSSRVEGVITGSGTNKHYWRRSVNDDTFTSINAQLIYKGTVTSDTLPVAATDNKGWYYKINAEVTVKGNSCKAGDYLISTGSKYKKIEFSNSAGGVEWYEATAWWKAPYLKQGNQLSIYDTNDCKMEYTDIYSRPDLEYYVINNTSVNSTGDYVEPEGDEEEPILEDDDDYKFSTPKMGTCETSETNPFLIYHACVQNLKNHRYPKVNVKVDLKDLNQLTGDNSNKFNIYDLLFVKIPNCKELLSCIIKGTEKNPHSLGENKITLTNVESSQPVSSLIQPVLLTEDISLKSNTSKKYKGRLCIVDEEEDDDGIPSLKYTGLSNQLVSLCITKPETTKTTNTTTYTTTYKGSTSKSTNKKNKYWSKYGLSPDKKTVTGIGYRSTGKDTIKWGIDYQGIYKNKCPNCGRTGTLKWYRGKNIQKRKRDAKQDGQFTCSGCDSDFSVQGHEKAGRKKGLTKVSFAKSSKSDSNRLLNGKLVYDAITATTTKNKTVKSSTTKNTKTTTTKVAGWTKVITTKTDKNGYFTFSLKLPGIEKDKYTLEFSYGGDLNTNSCTSKVYANCPAKAVSVTDYVRKINSSSSSSKSKTRRYNRIKRGSGKGYSKVVSKAVWEKANKIVGNKTGVEAVKLLANWVSNRKNISYVNKRNFYHSPFTTLKKGKGNCCCKADLFLQMCEAAGVFQCDGIKGYYVHGPGHVYTQIQYKTKSGVKKLVYVDPTKSSNPWGHVCKGYFKPISKKTKYPKLPFDRSY